MGVCFLPMVFVVVQLESTGILEAALKDGCCCNYSIVSDNGVLGHRDVLGKQNPKWMGTFNISSWPCMLAVANVPT